MLSSLLLGVALVSTGQARPDPPALLPYPPYAAGVPQPEAMLGYALGSRITTYRDQERVVLAIAAAAPSRTRVFEFGKSVEGRPLRVVAISAPENIARLEQIREEHRRVAAGDTSVARQTVPIVWINQTIHGNEPASFESAMALIYNLAASNHRSVTDALKNAVVIVNPGYNPDGHERFAVYYNSVAVGSPDRRAYEMSEPGVIMGRTNHYRFDMNRDRVAFSQDETRQEVAEFLRWNPQVYVDQHGQVDNYFFPPNPMSINVNADRDRLNRWTDLFGKATAKAFDERGYAYYVRDIFDAYYPGYLDSFGMLTGAIGMTHETDGGKQIARERSDGTVLTLRRGIEKHLTAALAVIRESAARRSDLMQSYAEFKQNAVSGRHAGKFQRVVVVSDDPRPLQRLKEQLDRAGVQSGFAVTAWEQDDAHDYWSTHHGRHRFPAGSLVIDMAQSQGPLAKALLEPQSDFEPEFFKAQQAKRKTAPAGEEYPGPEQPEFYDWTGWALPYAHNLRAWWCESAPKQAVSSTAPRLQTGGNEARAARQAAAAMALHYRDVQDILAIHDLLAQGVNFVVTPNESLLETLEGAAPYRFPRGTFFAMAERNDPGYLAKIEEVEKRRGVRFHPVKSLYPVEGRQSPGSENAFALKKPKIGVVFGRPGELGGVGGIWFLLERVFELPFTPLSVNALNGNLGDFTTLVVPAVQGVSATQALRDWVRQGGSLVVLENIGWALGSSAFGELSRISDVEPLPGSLFRARLDPRSFVSYGYDAPQAGPIEIGVPLSGGDFYKARKEGGSFVTLDPDPAVKKLLTGWSWEDDTEKHLAGAVWLQVFPQGRGHVTLFAQDPTERTMWPGLYKLLLNAMLLGPRN